MSYFREEFYPRLGAWVILKSSVLSLNHNIVLVVGCAVPVNFIRYEKYRQGFGLQGAGQEFAIW